MESLQIKFWEFVNIRNLGRSGGLITLDGTLVGHRRLSLVGHHQLSLVGHHGVGLVARCRLILIAFVPVEMVAPVLKPSQF